MVKLIQPITSNKDDKLDTCVIRIGATGIDLPACGYECSWSKPFSALPQSGNATIHTEVLRPGDEVLTQIDRVVP